MSKKHSVINPQFMKFREQHRNGIYYFSQNNPGFDSLLIIYKKMPNGQYEECVYFLQAKLRLQTSAEEIEKFRLNMSKIIQQFTTIGIIKKKQK